MKRTKFLLFIVFSMFLFTFCSENKNNTKSDLPKITQEEMYQDFDTLVHIIENVNPQLTIKKKITGKDLLSQLKSMRNEIKDFKNTEDFILMITRALTLMQDGHCNILMATPFIMPYDIANKFYNINNPTAYNNTSKYINAINNIENKSKFWLTIKYINGEYYLCESFKYHNKNFEDGFKLIEFNGENIHSFVQKLTKYRIRMRWDNENNRYFSDRLFWSLPYLQIRYFSLTFLDKHNKRIIDFFDAMLPANGKDYPYFVQGEKEHVKYINHDNTLYIRLEKMSLNCLKLDEINEVAKNKKIEKVIIDIRNNSGGDDSTWVNLLGRIIDKPIIYPIKTLVKNTELVRNKLKDEIKKDSKIERISLLDNEEFIVLYSQNDTIYPDNKSIKFKGKIFLLQDNEIYSSSLALSCVASYSDKIVSVGQKTGWMGGRCITPIAFTLPNTKLIFTIEPSIDATNINSINDFWKDTVEVPVNIPFEYYLKQTKNDKDVVKFEDDPFYIKVLELK